MPTVGLIAISHDLPLILVVDDDKTMRLLLRRAMEQEGYRVIEASNGERCLLTAFCACSQRLNI